MKMELILEKLEFLNDEITEIHKQLGAFHKELIKLRTDVSWIKRLLFVLMSLVISLLLKLFWS